MDGEGSDKNGCDVFNTSNYDWGDVAVSAAASAILPGIFSSGKKVLTAGRAIGNLSGQLQRARTVNRIARIDQRIAKNIGKVGNALTTQTAVQGGKALVKGAVGSEPCGCKQQ